MPFITIAGKRLEYQRIGKRSDAKPTLVFLHEGLGSLSQWRDLPEQVAAKTGCSSLVYSRAGYGQSAPAQLPRGVDFMHREAIEVLPELLKKMNEREVILVGHSDGGSIALIYASNPTIPVRALALQAPHVFVEDITIRSIARAKDEYLTGELKPRLAKHHPETDDTFLGWVNIWLNPEFRSWNIEKVLPQVKIPVLVIQGEEDQYGTVKQFEAIQQSCSGPVEVFLIPECGHRPHIEKAPETLDRIVDFVNLNL